MSDKKIAMVTGAGKGIGLAVVRKLAQKGVDLLLLDISPEALELAKAEVIACGTDVLTCCGSVTDEAFVFSAAEDALRHFGAIDILVNNAGIYKTDVMPFVCSESVHWKKKIDVNILGTMLCTRAVLPGMLQRRYGRIVNIASVAGVYGIQSMVDYSMTKGAVISFTRALAKEVAEYGVTVNAVSPGSINVDGVDLPGHSFMNRSGTPEECAEVICFLAGEEASYMSGQNTIVDGCRRKM